MENWNGELCTFVLLLRGLHPASRMGQPRSSDLPLHARNSLQMTRLYPIKGFYHSQQPTTQVVVTVSTVISWTRNRSLDAKNACIQWPAEEGEKTSKEAEEKGQEDHEEGFFRARNSHQWVNKATIWWSLKYVSGYSWCSAEMPERDCGRLYSKLERYAIEGFPPHNSRSTYIYIHTQDSIGTSIGIFSID